VKPYSLEKITMSALTGKADISLAA